MTFSYMHVIYWRGVIGHILPLSEDNIYRVLNKCITILCIPYIRGRSPQWRRLAKPLFPQPINCLPGAIPSLLFCSTWTLGSLVALFRNGSLGVTTNPWGTAESLEVHPRARKCWDSFRVQGPSRAQIICR